MLKNNTPLKKGVAVLICLAFTYAPAIWAQPQQAAQKLEQIAKQLNLTPEQKMQLIPILESEAPRVEAIKSNASLSGLQKLEQLRALHKETDPQVRSILSPQQYEKLQQIRDREIQSAIKRKLKD
jgi:hypothetical protein